MGGLTTDRPTDAYGWARYELSERWHICDSLTKAIDGVLDDAKDRFHGDVAGWLCRAHKVLPSDFLSNDMVQQLIERIDEEAGETVGVDDALFRSMSNERVVATRKKLAEILDSIWKPTLWYHEVQDVAPLEVRFGTLRTLRPVPGDYLRSGDENEGIAPLSGWLQFLRTEEARDETTLLLFSNRACIEVAKDKKFWCASVGDWKGFGSR